MPHDHDEYALIGPFAVVITVVRQRRCCMPLVVLPEELACCFAGRSTSDGLRQIALAAWRTVMAGKMAAEEAAGTLLDWRNAWRESRLEVAQDRAGMYVLAKAKG